jgi:hypothetical protein
MAYEAPRVNESRYADATSEMWHKEAASTYCLNDDGQFNPVCALRFAADTSIDEKTQHSHSEWVKNSARWQGSSSSFRQDRIEITPPGSWLFKPPSAVPMAFDRPTVNEYGPREFSEFEGSNKFYCHTKLQPHEFHPQNTSNKFSRYGI